MADEPLKDVPAHWLGPIFHLLTGFHNLTDKEVTEPILKPALENIYFLFIIQYAFLAIVGIASNVYVIYYIIRHRLYRDETHAFIINLSLCHLVQCGGVLPVTLMVILIQNWIFGQFMCYFVPLLQDIPLHAALLTHMLIAWDRMRWLTDPMNSRLPAFVCCCATWLTGMVIALPYPIYTTYLDLGLYEAKFHGVGICIVNLVDDMLEYTRGLFFLMYCAPTIVLGYLYIHTAKELRPPEGPLSIMMYEHRADIRNRQRSATSSTRSGGSRTTYTRSYDLYDAELDASREKRSQCHLGGMAATQVICICPLMILRIARMVLVETYENTAHFDITYLMFVWMAFLPTVINPCIYAAWVLSRPTKDKLRRYFRLSSRQSESDNKLTTHRSTENSVTQENTTETIDEPKIYHTQTTDKTSANKAISKLNATGVSTSVSGATKQPLARLNRASTKTRNSTHREPTIVIGQPTKKHSLDEVNNSCSNITSSTYCNGNGVSTSSGIGIDFESSVYNERRPLCDQDSVYSGVSGDRYSHRSRDLLSDCENLSVRRESSSTYERDMDIIDLLERERSMDIQDMMERERRAEQVRKKQTISRNSSSFERHRKLPDITKITTPNSPKRCVPIEHTPNIPNFVFTHQQNEYAEARAKRNRNRQNSHGSLGKRNSDVHELDIDEQSSESMMVASASISASTRITRNNTRGNDLRKSSTKSIRDPRKRSSKYGDNIYTDDL